MANYRVKRTGKYGGDITRLCGDWGNHAKAEAISNIEHGIHTYSVEEQAPTIYVEVVDARPGKYLRTRADATSKNNLDNLPDC